MLVGSFSGGDAHERGRKAARCHARGGLCAGRLRRFDGDGYVRFAFSLNFVIDSDFDTTGAFYDEQLAAQGWEETDRTEGTV